MTFATLLALATAAPSAPAVQPLEVFGNVCLNGEAAFAPGTIEKASASSLPRDARQLAMLALWLDAYSFSGHRYVLPSEMPSEVFAFPTSEDEMFLLSPDENAANPIAGSCTVIVKGNHLDRANPYLAAASGSETRPFSRKTTMISYDTASHRLVAASLQGWTLVSAVPVQFLNAKSPTGATKQAH